jgi:hypothetical protein
MTAGPTFSANRFPPGTSRRRTTLERLAIGIFLLLSIEFVLGMVLALFVSLPLGPGVVAILGSSPVLLLHLVVAVSLVGISARALTLARRSAGRVPRYASTLALGSSVTATLAGWDFAFYGQSPIASFVMALGFLGVLAGAFLLRAPPREVVPALAPGPGDRTDLGRAKEVG